MGQVTQRYDYDSFGTLRSRLRPITQPYTYTGREFDRETGLYYYRARYYDPEAGRFVTRDPIGFLGGDVNLYAYVMNNPVNWVDPWGLVWVTVGYEYFPVQNYFNYIWNRLWQGFHEEISEKNLVNLRRDVIQEWQCDPQNPSRDQEHPIGSQRKIRQHYRQFMNPGPGEVIIRKPHAHFFYQWDPWVKSPTYDSSLLSG